MADFVQTHGYSDAGNNRTRARFGDGRLSRAPSVRKSIHTLDARDNVMLEVMRDYFQLNPTQMFREIQQLRDATEEALAQKGISYTNLRSALVPDSHKREVALVFDSTQIENGWYGYEVFRRVIPLFDKQANLSVLAGDYLDRPGDADHMYEAFAQAVHMHKEVVYRHPTQFFVVYINHLSEAAVEGFDMGLRDFAPYVGFADMTYASMFKIYLSTMLVNCCIKHGTTILQGHEPDRPATDDVNMRGYPFEDNGYICRSVSDDLMGVMLSYKIERPVFQGFEVDTEFALNAISLTPKKLRELTVEVDEAKVTYLKSAKSDSMERAGLEAVSANQLAELIKRKMLGSYIYNLAIDETHDVRKFNIILELPPKAGLSATRLMAAMQYQPEIERLRLITLY